MDGPWSFRTERGRARVADGHLRVDGSARSLLESTYREKWVRANCARKALFLFSIAGTAAWFGRAIPAARALAGPARVGPLQWFVLAATAFVVLVALRRLGRSERVSLVSVESTTRTGRSLAVEYAEAGGNAEGGRRAVTGGNTETGDTRTLEVEALTDDDAEQAVEILRLKGVRVERRQKDADVDREIDDNEPREYVSARERLAEKNGD